MAANYFGLVLGGKIGHRLIARVGHIRAYSACAGIVGAAVLGHGLIDWLPAWLFLRVIVGLGMMCQYMVIESWLNEQADAKQRGLVFSGYMIASYLGLVLGQLILVMHPAPGPGTADAGRAVLRPVPGAGGPDPTDSPGAAASGTDGTALLHQARAAVVEHGARGGADHRFVLRSGAAVCLAARVVHRAGRSVHG